MQIQITKQGGQVYADKAAEAQLNVRVKTGAIEPGRYFCRWKYDSWSEDDDSFSFLTGRHPLKPNSDETYSVNPAECGVDDFIVTRAVIVDDDDSEVDANGELASESGEAPVCAFGGRTLQKRWRRIREFTPFPRERALRFEFWEGPPGDDNMLRFKDPDKYNAAVNFLGHAFLEPGAKVSLDPDRKVFQTTNRIPGYDADATGRPPEGKRRIVLYRARLNVAEKSQFQMSNAHYNLRGDMNRAQVLLFFAKQGDRQRPVRGLVYDLGSGADLAEFKRMLGDLQDTHMRPYIGADDRTITRA